MAVFIGQLMRFMKIEHVILLLDRSQDITEEEVK